MPYRETRSAEIASVASLHRNDTFLCRRKIPPELKKTVIMEKIVILMIDVTLKR
jgi:hypothetical protein